MTDRRTSLLPETIQELRSQLLAHYDQHRRDLPWRQDVDPYRIWVSEVMLQQTRVETVIPYYRRWMERFPSVEALAGADQEEVLQHWKGLGYYSRARNLHRAARMVREVHGGELPSSPEGLRELPGVGAYTAGAVASIAFQVPAPAVDGNVRRVLSRLFDHPEPGSARLREWAGTLIDPERPGDFNQAVMELGATVCTPSAPLCGRCPIEELCRARERGTVEDRPAPRKKAKVSSVTMAVGISVDEAGRALLVRRPDDGLLGGMWEFPAVEVRTASGSDVPGNGISDARAIEEAADAIRRAAGSTDVLSGRSDPVRLDPVTHEFSHLRATYLPVVFPGAALDSGLDETARRVVGLDDLDSLPLPVAQQKIGAIVRRCLEER